MRWSCPHLDDALSLARWLTGNGADAEDIVQDACIRAYKAITSARDGNPRAWLLAIVRNTAFTWLAKNRPKALVVTDDERLFEQAGLEMIDRADAATPEAVLIAKADADLLNRAIAALPLPYREVLVLREIEGLSYREISEIMSIPVGDRDVARWRAPKLAHSAGRHGEPWKGRYGMSKPPSWTSREEVAAASQRLSRQRAGCGLRARRRAPHRRRPDAEGRARPPAAICARRWRATGPTSARPTTSARALRPLPSPPKPVAARRISFAHRHFEWRQMAAAAAVAAFVASGATYLGLQQAGTSSDIASIVAGHQRALLASAAVRCGVQRPPHRQAVVRQQAGALSAGVGSLQRWFPACGRPRRCGRRQGCSRHGLQAARHVISLVAVPKPGSRDTGAPPARTSRDGYSALTWPGADFEYSAVSDVADAELSDFVANWRKAASAK